MKSAQNKSLLHAGSRPVDWKCRGGDKVEGRQVWGLVEEMVHASTQGITMATTVTATAQTRTEAASCDEAHGSLWKASTALVHDVESRMQEAG